MVQSVGSHRLTKDWQPERNNSEYCSKYCSKAAQIVTHIRLIRDEHRIQISNSWHGIESLTNSKLIHLASCQAACTLWTFSQTRIETLVSQTVVTQAQIKWGAPTVILTICCFIYFKRHDSLPLRDTYIIPEMDECIDSLGKTTLYCPLCQQWI